MERLSPVLAAAGMILLLGLLADPASAGDYHVGGTLTCAECHVNGRQLSRLNVNETCLSCHGTAATTAPSVLGTNPSGGPRQAGALN